MSRWRQVAIETMPHQAKLIRVVLGIFGFWEEMRRQLSHLDAEGGDARLPRALGLYCDWYLAQYGKNPYLFTALCYGFAEDLTQDQQAAILPFVSLSMKQVIRECIEAKDESRVAHRSAPVGLHPGYFPTPPRPRRRNDSRQRRAGEIKRLQSERL